MRPPPCPQARLADRTVELDSYSAMKETLESGDAAQVGFYLVPWRDDSDNEAKIKEETKVLRSRSEQQRGVGA